jgi:hypothetical protein
VVNKLALGQIFSEYFGFFFQFSFYQPLHINLLSLHWRCVVRMAVTSLNNEQANFPKNISH